MGINTTTKNMLAVNTLSVALFCFRFSFGVGQQTRGNSCGSTANSGPPGHSGELKCFTTGSKTESALCQNGQWVPQGACQVGYTVEAFIPHGNAPIDCPAHKPVCKGSYHTHSKTCTGECIVEQRRYSAYLNTANNAMQFGSQLAGLFG